MKICNLVEVFILTCGKRAKPIPDCSGGRKRLTQKLIKHRNAYDENCIS